MNDDATGFLYFEEFMGPRVTISLVCNARGAHVIVLEDVSAVKEKGEKYFVPGQSKHLCLTPRMVDSQTSQITPVWTGSSIGLEGSISRELATRGVAVSEVTGAGEVDIGP